MQCLKQIKRQQLSVAASYAVGDLSRKVTTQQRDAELRSLFADMSRGKVQKQKQASYDEYE